MPLALALRRTLVDGLRRLYGARLRRVFLYGSEARGEATAESDVDVLVVPAGEVDRWIELDRVTDLAVEALDRFRRLVGFVVMDEGTYRYGDWPLLTNMREEGVELFAIEEVAG